MLIADRLLCVFFNFKKGKVYNHLRVRSHIEIEVVEGESNTLPLQAAEYVSAVEVVGINAGVGWGHNTAFGVELGINEKAAIAGTDQTLTHGIISWRKEKLKFHCLNEGSI